MNRYLIALPLLMLCLTAKAQLNVQNVATVESLVSNVLLGEGVETTNLSFNHGSADSVRSQFGYFTGGLPHIGLERGVILASGGVKVAEGPNDIPTAHEVVPLHERLNEDADLSALVGGSVLRDVAIIEFDFTARGDTLRFRYVFASEEYNDHTCSPYNDAFGFFVSGPGIVGSPNFTNAAKNVALVPGTNVPVAINTINQGFAGVYGANAVCNAAYSGWQANSVYFVNNAGNNDPGTTQFDGFTVPFLIEIPVVCGETYHIKLAIADAVDDKNDSAVFLEAESFSSEVLLDASLSVESPDEESQLALEGCSKYRIDMQRTDSLREKTLYFRARNLENVSAILEGFPESLTFEVGESSKSVTFSTQNDGAEQGLRNWEVEILHPNACGQDTAVFTLPAVITDRPNLSIDLPGTIYVPCNAVANVMLTPQGGNPPYAIVWNNEGFEGFELFLNSDTSFTLSGTLSDHCNLNEIDVSLDIEKEQYPDLQVSIPSSVSFGCIDPVQVIPEITGGSGDYTFRWSMHDSVLTTSEVFNEVLNVPGTISLEVSDRCVDSKTASMSAVLLANPVQVKIGEDRVGTCLEEVLLVPEVIGGFGGLSYLWKQNNNEVSAEPIFSFKPVNTVRMTLIVTDQCGQSDRDTTNVFVYDPPLEVHLPPDTTLCRGQRLELNPLVSGAIGEVSYEWPVSGGTLSSYVLIPQRDNRFIVKVTDECERIAEAAVNVWVSDVEAAFAFDYDFPENPIRNLSTPNCNYTWTFPDGSTSTLPEPHYAPTSNQGGAVSLEVVNSYGCVASSIEFFDPPMLLFIPTAFTPDGNGRNDEFKAVGHHVDSFHLWIFDKWGTLVFETTDINEGWNGEGASGDGMLVGDHIYPYRYVAKSWSGEVREGKGTVTLLR